MKFAQQYSFPDFVKKASLDEITGNGITQSNLYADVRPPLQFPCHTKAAAVVSYAFFLEKQSELGQKVQKLISDRFDKFAEYWNLKNTFKAFRDKAAAQKSAENIPDDQYAFVWEGANGVTERRYPVRNAAEVKAAADWFVTYNNDIRQQFGFNDRQVIAEKIVTKAAQYGADLGSAAELLEQQAGRGVCNPTSAAKAIRERTKIAHRCTPVMQAGMDKLANMLETNAVICLDPDTMYKLADTIDQFDRTHGLLNKYTENIPTPESLLFPATYTKIAELKDDMCQLVTGAIYDKTDFAKLAAGDIHELFGDDIAGAVCSGIRVDPVKMADVAATFPRNDAAMFEQLLADKEIKPFAKEASNYGLTMQQYCAIAE